MGRYTGPKHKLARREGVNILDKTSASLQRRLNVPPGIHGRKRRRAPSEFGQQLREKQKAKAIYGLLEKQLKSVVNDVRKKRGDTGELLLSLLETRLDNLVYRLAFAKTRFQARQFVTHGHVLVNGKKVNIPSYKVKESDTIALEPKFEKNPIVVSMFAEKPVILAFLDRKNDSGKLIRMPKKEDLQVPFDTQLIIEYYSR
ncbi:30S ribosomal protein S4 [Candidatus Microgenomates bacterium]|nr:MAG: 30S ribosomal protein S4 [Candidatus Microgenomates bacterium]